MHLKYILLAVLSIGTLTILFQTQFNLETHINHSSIKTRNLLDFAKNSLNFKVVPITSKKESTNIGNVPESYLKTPETSKKKYNSTCAIYPNLFDIKFTNEHWQTQSTSNGTLQLFNAYLDRRLASSNGSLVRIVGMMDRLRLNETTYYCQFWYEKSTKPVVMPTSGIYKPWIDSWGPKLPLYSPYIFTCPLSDEKRVPDSVSLVETPCQNATNNLRVKYEPVEKKKDFVVCVKGLDFPFTDVSVKLIEWIELLFLVGADKINLYQFQVHPNVQRVLNYYESLGRIELTPITLVGPFSNNPHLQDLFLHKKLMHRRLQEIIPYNDCLYKHLHQFNHVVLLDTDEVIVPKHGGTWKDIIPATQKKFPKLQLTSMMARNVYFMDNVGHVHDWFPDIPQYLHMAQHVYRAKEYTKPGSFVKGFHSTEHVVGLHNHFALVCLHGKCLSREIDLEVAHLQHYRKDCAGGVGKELCNEFKEHSVMDTRVWYYKSDLIKNVKRVLDDLNIVP